MASGSNTATVTAAARYRRLPVTAACPLPPPARYRRLPVTAACPLPPPARYRRLPLLAGIKDPHAPTPS